MVMTENLTLKRFFFSNMLLAFSSQAEVISPSEELLNNQVINDFDIEEEEIQIENRYVNLFNDIEVKICILIPTLFAISFFPVKEMYFSLLQFLQRNNLYTKILE